MSKHLIDVTAEDIKDGVRGRCKFCPIALSAQRTFGRVMIVQPTVLWDELGRGMYDLPSNATNFIKRFDAGLPVEPFSFEVN